MPFYLLGIDRLAHIVGRDDTHQPYLAGLHIDLHFGRLRNVTIGKVGLAGAGLRVIRGCSRRPVDVFTYRRPVLILPGHQGALGRPPNGVAGHEAQPAGGGAAGIVGGGGISGHKLYSIHRHSHRLGRHLRHQSVRPLSTVCPRLVEYYPFDLRRAV